MFVPHFGSQILGGPIYQFEIYNPLLCKSRPAMCAPPSRFYLPDRLSFISAIPGLTLGTLHTPRCIAGIGVICCCRCCGADHFQIGYGPGALPEGGYEFGVFWAVMIAVFAVLRRRTAIGRQRPIRLSNLQKPVAVACVRRAFCSSSAFYVRGTSQGGLSPGQLTITNPGRRLQLPFRRARCGWAVLIDGPVRHEKKISARPLSSVPLAAVSMATIFTLTVAAPIAAEAQLERTGAQWQRVDRLEADPARSDVVVTLGFSGKSLGCAPSLKCRSPPFAALRPGPRTSDLPTERSGTSGLSQYFHVQSQRLQYGRGPGSATFPSPSVHWVSHT